MTRTIHFRRIASSVAIALGLGTIAAPASARTFDFNSHGSLVQQPARSTSPSADPASDGTGIEWGYIAVGASSAALILIGVGAVASGHTRSRQHTAVTSRDSS